jgi:hypothetical protein
LKLFLHKLTHWEYWPFQIVYIPIYFLWVFYAIKSRSLFFFNASNPSIQNGGFMNESKMKIYDLIPQKYYPKTQLISSNSQFHEALNIQQTESILMPFIAKPDIGLRGSGVKKINSIQDFESYHQKADFNYLIQNLIPYPNEIGVFYVRFPNQQKGKITGIVAKEFLIVEGDGTSTIQQLVLKNPRYAFQLEALKKDISIDLNEIIAVNEKRNLVPFGNHARGAKFMDASDLISSKLNDVIDKMCQEIPEFYFGRLDIMYESIADLENGNHFLIVEINGAGSEPTHIYDPKHSLFFAWKELARHITYMYKISRQNHKKGISYLTFKEGVKEYKLHLEQSKKIIEM